MAASALHAAVVATVLLLPSLLAPVAAQAKAKAFCISQFAIASQACSILPPSPPEDDHHHHDDDADHDDDDHHGEGDDDYHDHGRRGRAAISISALMATNDSNGPGGNDTGHHGNRTRGGHGRGRRGRLRDDHDNDHDHGHDDDDHGGDNDHGNDHDHGDDDDDEDDDDHEHHDEELRAYRDCCRWLKEVQKDCVCEALLRLPPFLVKPQHTYVVRVGRTCRITYRCGGI